MNITIKSSLCFCLIALAFVMGSAQAEPQDENQQNMSAQTLSTLIERYRGTPYDDFDRFALDVYVTGKRFLTKHQHDAIGEYAANERLTAQQSFVIHRLLGVYTRLKYGGEARRMLAKLVSVPSYHQEGVESHKNRNFVRLQKAIASYAKRFGLKYKNVGGRVYEVSLPSSKRGSLIGLHVHIDVAPVNRDQWVLKDGVTLDPFKMTQVGDRLYGRGTQNNKNAIVAVMMAMRIVKEEKIQLFNKARLLISTSEEASVGAIPYYLKKNPTPSYNIALDGHYPAVFATNTSNEVEQQGAWLKGLLDIAAENLDLPKAESAPNTDLSEHGLPNLVQFGLLRPHQQYAGYDDHEFKTIDDFLLDLQIVTEMIMRMGLTRILD